MDGSSTFGWMLLGLQEELQERGRLAAEPWNRADGEKKGRPAKKAGRAASPSPSCEPCPTADACCCEA